MQASDANALFSWFRSQNGVVDTSSMGFRDFPGIGRGAVALQDIPEGHTLFSIPRQLTLSMRTSSLPGLMGKSAWKQFGLGTGWVGLILCMMWEESRGQSSPWSTYMCILPSHFDTPMFWNDEDLQELQGTSVVEKIGKADAERDYHEKLVPAVKSRPDLFPPNLLDQHFSVERYHIMGSRILSRSFQVEEWKGEDHSEDEEDEHHDHEPDAHAMDVDTSDPAIVVEAEQDSSHISDAVEDDADSDDEDEDSDDPADVAMVPMADMLNARFESENAKLFYEEHDLKMVTTKAIKAGEQIWNTYGDPPNSDLLRRYGHVDLVPLGPPLGGEGNPEDVVEIRADLVISILSRTVKNDFHERVDWWLEIGEDDTFVLRTDCVVPSELVSFVRLLSASADEWEKMKSKSKTPKSKADAEILSCIIHVLEARLAEYPTTIEVDEALLTPENISSLSLNKRNSVIVRLGEKRILRGTLLEVRKLEEALRTVRPDGSSKKRSRDAELSASKGSGKKARR